MGKNILSDFTLTITRKTKCSAPGKKFGIVTRYVKFIGRDSGESEEFELPVEAMARPVAFRCFCYSHGNYNSMIGGRELGYLIQDLDADYDRREILGQNAIVVAPATLEPESKNDVVAG